MPPTAAQTLLSPAELAFLHSSLSLDPPIRPDGRSSTTFRPLIAETDILPSTYGSARICFADGTESIVGVKAEVQSTERTGGPPPGRDAGELSESEDVDMEAVAQRADVKEVGKRGRGSKTWVEMSIEIPGYRDDDTLPVFLSSLLNEALIANTELVDKLYINDRYHWKLYIDVLLLSPPLSYPVPLLSLTIHLALLTTSLPALVSEGNEDPLFNDDWAAATPLYPESAPALPPITLLVAGVGKSLMFDPSKEELAVADGLVAVSLAQTDNIDDADAGLRLLTLRTIDPLARLTTPGVPDSQNAAALGLEQKPASTAAEVEPQGGVWRPPQGGMRRDLIPKVVALCTGREGVASEVLRGLKAFRSKSQR